MRDNSIKKILSELIINEKEALELLLNSIEQKKGIVLTYFNQNSFNLCYSDDEFRKILKNHFRVYAADSGVYFIMKYIFSVKTEFINASEFNNVIFDRFIEQKLPIVVIGGKFYENIKRFAEEKKLTVQEYIDGFKVDYQDYIRRLEKYDSPVVIIGMGSPQQEILAKMISDKNKNAAVICVGNFLEFYFGTIKRAPKWLIDSGFEWIFRLITEPRRLWKRYVFGIPVFICRAIKLKIQNDSL